MAGALEAVDRQEVDSKPLGGQGVADGGALVQDDGVGGLELLDERARIVAGCLDNAHALVDQHLRVGVIVGRHQRGQQRQIHAKRPRRHGPASPDLVPQVFGRRLCQRR